MDALEIIQYRLVNQQIAESNLKKPEEIINCLGAMQAQEFSQAKWAIGLRLPHISESEIDNAFINGRIIRTHILRPTWHFVSPKDVRWMLSLSAPRVKAANAFMYRKMELDDKTFRKTNTILAKALEGGRQLTRNSLAKELQRKKITGDGTRLSCIMMQAELDGIICSGAKEGKQFTYALLDEIVPPARPMKEDEALAELTKRYLNSRGPATLKDFAVWSGLSIAQVKKGLALAAPDFSHTNINNENYYFPPGTLDKTSSKQNIHLLPIYDEYIMGYKDRSFYFNSKYKINPSSTYTFDNTIIINGQIAGTWKRMIHKNSIDLVYNLFKPFNKTEKKEFVFTIDQYSKFTGLPVNLKQNK